MSNKQVIDKRWYPGKPRSQMIIWIKRGGSGGTGNNGPTGWKLRPAARQYRAAADMARGYGVVNGVRKAAGPRAKER